MVSSAMHGQWPGELLRVQALDTGYGPVQVLWSIDLRVVAGEILGLLGANGSGKSTLLRAITGQLPLWAGTVMIAGVDLAAAPEQAKAKFGYVVDAADLPPTLTGMQYLELIASIKGCGPTDWPADDLLELLSLSLYANQLIGEYSFGTRVKFAISAALLGSPPLLVFDESLNGLDPVASWRVKQLLRDLARSGQHGVILSTHQLETVAALCDTAMLLSEGRNTQRWDRHELERARSQEGGFEQAVMTALGEEPTQHRRLVSG
jgi:ABC-2 type transport system ATP-binding protein